MRHHSVLITPITGGIIVQAGCLEFIVPTSHLREAVEDLYEYILQPGRTLRKFALKYGDPEEGKRVESCDARERAQEEVYKDREKREERPTRAENGLSPGIDIGRDYRSL